MMIAPLGGDTAHTAAVGTPGDCGPAVSARSRKRRSKRQRARQRKLEENADIKVEQDGTGRGGNEGEDQLMPDVPGRGADSLHAGGHVDAAVVRGAGATLPPDPWPAVLRQGVTLQELMRFEEAQYGTHYMMEALGTLVRGPGQAS